MWLFTITLAYVLILIYVFPTRKKAKPVQTQLDTRSMHTYTCMAGHEYSQAYKYTEQQRKYQ